MQLITYDEFASFYSFEGVHSKISSNKIHQMELYYLYNVSESIANFFLVKILGKNLLKR